jgi:hypothetical protein
MYNDGGENYRISNDGWILVQILVGIFFGGFSVRKYMRRLC